MQDELFGPIVAVHVFPDRAFQEMTVAINEQSRYGLTARYSQPSARPCNKLQPTCVIRPEIYT